MDMSRAEIAEVYGISPQEVRDALVRAQKTLEEYESKLGIAAKTAQDVSLLEHAEACGMSKEAEKDIDAALDILKR